MSFCPTTSLIIPTYLKLQAPEEIPTAEGILLLKRAVESLNILESNELKVITVFCVDTEKWIDEFDTAIREVVKDFQSKFPIFTFTEKNLRNLKRYLKEKGHLEITEKLSICGYPNIRNCGLIIANILDADVSIFIDNDEVIENKDFLKTACEYLNTDYKGIRVNGKGGFYISHEGGIVEKPQFQWWQFFWNKGRLISETMKKVFDAKDRLVESPIILGGNLVLHRNLFTKVPFDPLIPRGEDIDYLINSKRLGFNILFDKNLKVRHLHPQRTIAFRKDELKGDIERFIYEREKIKESNISVDPYPGYFLKKSLPLKAVLTIQFLAIHLFLKLRIRDAIDVLGYKNLISYRQNNVWEKYIGFQRDWESFMEFINKNRLDIITLIQ